MSPLGLKFEDVGLTLYLLVREARVVLGNGVVIEGVGGVGVVRACNTVFREWGVRSSGSGGRGVSI